jgi:hypothetical protein
MGEVLQWYFHALVDFSAYTKKHQQNVVEHTPEYDGLAVHNNDIIIIDSSLHNDID